MTKQIKRIHKKSYYLMLALGGIITILFTRLFLGSSHINLKELEKIRESAVDISIIPSAEADASTGCGDGDGCADGSGGRRGRSLVAAGYLFSH